MSTLAPSHRTVFATPGARVEHELRGASLAALLRRLRDGLRPAPLDRDELLARHSHRMTARDIRDQAARDALRLGGLTRV